MYYILIGKWKLMQKTCMVLFNCYVFVFELNSAEGDDWNNIDTADEIIDLS